MRARREARRFHSDSDLLKVDERLTPAFKAQCSSPQQILERTACDLTDMAPYLPRQAEHVIDLGCGSGRLSAALNNAYPRWEATYWLVDGDSHDFHKLHWGQYENDGVARFYNQRALTEHLCRINSLLNYRYVLVEDSLKWSQYPPPADLLFSNRSIGWHFPVDIYKDVYPRILKPGAVCLFTWRRELEQTLPAYFEQVTMERESFQNREILVVRYQP